MKGSTSVQEYINCQDQWKIEVEKLISIARCTNLDENIKWGIPTYTVKNKNILGIAAFKSYVGIWFFNGSFLTDAHNVLINAQEGKTKGMRQWRFNSIEEIDDVLITAYINEAIDNQKSGKEIKKTKSKPLDVPVELEELLTSNSKLKLLFSGFANYKQREFSEYISTAKRKSTKQSRLEKITPLILSGIGLNDKYVKK